MLWLSVAFYALLAGADFGVGFWVLVSRGSRNHLQLTREAFSYFSPLWEVNGLFLIFFLMGAVTAFSKVVGLLGRALIPLVLIALFCFVLRSASYVLHHHGPERLREPALIAFGFSSVVAAAFLVYAATAPASGLIIGRSLSSSYYTSAMGLTSLPLAVAASAHLAAVVITVHARAQASETLEWYRKGAIVSGIAASVTATVFMLAVFHQAPHTRDRLLSGYAAPLILTGLLVGSGLIAVRSRRYWTAVVLTFAGYLLGLVSGAIAQLPYLVYPALTLEQGSSPRSSIVAFLIAAALGGPLLLAGVVTLYATSLRPRRRQESDQIVRIA